MISDIDYAQQITYTLKSAHLLPVKFRIKFKFLLLV